MSARECILVCEPRHVGVEHGTFNAALLAALSAAWPDSRLIFAAEPGHVREVREALAEAAFPEDRLEERRWRSAGRSISFGRRGPREIWSACRALRLASRRQARVLVFASVSSSFLLVLRHLVRLGWFSGPILAIAHDILTGLDEAPAPSLFQRPLRIGAVLRGGLPANLRLLVLGEFIRRRVEQTAPAWARFFSAVDPPWLWPREVEGTHATGEILRFGFFGVGRKGLGPFFQLAQAVQRERPGRAEFVMVGHVNQRDASRWLDVGRSCVQGLSVLPLTRAEYAARARRVSYAVGVAPAQAYRWRISTAFLDALGFVKPGLYLANDGLRDYFARMGDVGYLCESLEEVHATALSLVDHFPADRYAAQQARLRAQRECFSPGTVGSALRRIVEQLAPRRDT